MIFKEFLKSLGFSQFGKYAFILRDSDFLNSEINGNLIINSKNYDIR